MPEPVPARVHILLARDAPTAVVIRRGPSRDVCTMSWDRTCDRFVVGQWLKARIYERRSDLSPDGRHLIYFAYDGRPRRAIRDSWTAISRAPYLKAIGLWANGSAWHGGGAFLSNTEYWLNRFPFGHTEVSVPRGLVWHKAFPFAESYGGECPGVYYNLLQRDGWLLRGLGPVQTFEKSLPHGWLLRKFAHATAVHPVGRGCYFDTHALVHATRGATLDRPDWSWAEWDPKRSRLVWVEHGILHAAPLTHGGIGAAQVLFDFNPLRFEELLAPY